jgi:adenylate cyclase
VRLALLFADVRGSTGMAESLTPADFADRMNRFYAHAAKVLIRHDALVDKFVGDEVLALFVPGYAGPEFAEKALAAARDLLEGTANGDGSEPWIPVGVGLHVGTAFVGVVGAENQVTDVTALGDAVNATSRLVSAAETGEIVISEEAAREAQFDTAGLEKKELSLKGRTAPMTVFVMRGHRSRERQPAQA